MTGFSVTSILIDDKIEFRKLRSKGWDKPQRVGQVRWISMWIYDCSWVSRSIFEVETDGIDWISFVLDQSNLLLIKWGNLYGLVCLESKLSICIVYFIFLVEWEVLGEDLTKTYRSMRYSLSPKKFKILNLTGSGSTFSEYLFLGSSSPSLVVSLQQFINNYIFYPDKTNSINYIKFIIFYWWVKDYFITQ